MNWKKTAKIDTDFGKEETTNVVWNCFEDLFLLGEKKKDEKLRVLPLKLIAFSACGPSVQLGDVTGGGDLRC